MAKLSIMADDLDHSIQEDVETLLFGLDGKTYSIDLGIANTERLRDFLTEFLAVATLVTNPSPAPAKRPRKPRAVKPAPATDDSGEQPAIVDPEPVVTPPFDTKVARAWLKENGHNPPSRGKLSDAVVEPYLASEDYEYWKNSQES